MRAALWILAAAPVLPGAAAAEPVVYRWAGTVLTNSGVGAIPVGSAAEGIIAWDPATPPDQPPVMGTARYTSVSCAFSFTAAGHTFGTAGPAIADVATSALGAPFDNFSVVGVDVTTPPGWLINHASLSDSYGLILQQNSEPFADTALPFSLDLAHWGLREVRMDFFHGVVFPGGSFTDRRTINATVDSLTLIPAPGVGPVLAAGFAAAGFRLRRRV